MSFAGSMYNLLFKRSSTMAVAMIAGAFIFERTVDLAVDQLWRSHNKGKLWADIKHKYEK